MRRQAALRAGKKEPRLGRAGARALALSLGVGQLAVVKVASTETYDTIIRDANAAWLASGRCFPSGSCGRTGSHRDMTDSIRRQFGIVSAVPVIADAVLVSLAGGCANYAHPPAGVALAPPAEPRFDALWRASIDVLREYRFRIDRRDRRAGVITTRPMLARHWFEFWRRDAVTVRDFLEGSLQTVYRRATVRIQPKKDDPQQYAPRVSVVVVRPAGGGLEIVGAGEAYGQFIDALDDDAYRRSRRDRRELRQQSIRQALEAEQAAASDPAESQETLARKIADEILRRAQKIQTAHRPG